MRPGRNKITNKQKVVGPVVQTHNLTTCQSSVIDQRHQTLDLDHWSKNCLAKTTKVYKNVRKILVKNQIDENHKNYANTIKFIKQNKTKAAIQASNQDIWLASRTWLITDLDRQRLLRQIIRMSILAVLFLQILFFVFYQCRVLCMKMPKLLIRPAALVMMMMMMMVPP